MSKPKDAAHKRNHEKIRLAVRSPILCRLKAKADAGGVLSTLDEGQLAELADLATAAVMFNENLSIVIKRSR